MGFLDRFTKDSNAPDAFTIEVVARIRALPQVDSAEAVDADTVAVTWSGRAEPETVDIGEQREPWKKLRGFDRIELMDGFIETLAPGPAPAVVATPEPEPPADVTEPPPPAAPAKSSRPWVDVAPRLLPVLRGTGPQDDAVTWPVDDLLEATVAESRGATPVSPAQCDVWGVGPEEVRSVATSNLEAVDPAPDQIGPDTAAWVPTGPHGLQSAWLAAPARLLDAVDLESGIVIVPLRSELVIVDPADAALVESILRDTLAILETQTDTLCPVPFLVTRDRVKAWSPPDDHPAAPLVQRTRDLLPR